MSSDQLAAFKVEKHIEETLGPVERRWSQLFDGSGLPFSVLRIWGFPTPDSVTYCTAGLADTANFFPSGRPARQELVFCCHERWADKNPEGLLASVAQDCARSREALARGAVLGPHGPLLPEARLEALYASLPAYFPTEFGMIRSTEPATHFLWMIAIAETEANFVKTAGWERFEEALERSDPDLLDLARDPLRLLSVS